MKLGLFFPGLLLMGCLLLTGCIRSPASKVLPAMDHLRVPPQLTLPQTLHIERDDGQQWLLVIQKEQLEHSFRFRFSLFDPLGVPAARRLIEQGHWRNDGLLPPNREAQELFDTLLHALNGHSPPVGQWQWSARAPQASLNEPGFPVESPYPLQTWPVIHLCKKNAHCYQFTPVQTP